MAELDLTNRDTFIENAINKGFGANDASQMFDALEKRDDKAYDSIISKYTKKPQEEDGIFEGFDTNLAKSTFDKLKKQREAGEQIQSQAYEGTGDEFLYNYDPDYWDLVKSFGIRTDQGLTKDIRKSLSYSINEPQYLKSNLKTLLSVDLEMNKGISKDLVRKHRDQIQTEIFNVAPKGAPAREVLAYKIPKELGGKNVWYSVNQEGFGIDDLYSVQGDAIPVAASIAMGVGGSELGPGGMIVGTGMGEAIGEFARLMNGYYYHNLNRELSSDDMLNYALRQAGKKGAVAGLSTAAFLPVANALLKLWNVTKGTNIPSSALKSLMESEGAVNQELIDIMKPLKDKLIKDFGISEDLASDYARISIMKAIPETETFIKVPTEKQAIYLKYLKEAQIKSADVEKQILKKITGLEDVPEHIAEETLSKIQNVSRNVINAEQRGISEGLIANQDSIKKNLNSHGYDPTLSAIDDFQGVASNLTKESKSAINNLEVGIDQYLSKNPVKVNIALKSSKEDFNAIKNAVNNLKFGDKKLFTLQPLPKAPGKGATPEDIKLYKQQVKEITERNNILKALDVESFNEVRNILESIKKGASDFGQVSYKDAERLLNLINNKLAVTENVSVSNGLLILKRNIKNALVAVETKHPKLAELVNAQKDAIYFTKNSALNDLAGKIGFGASRDVQRGFTTGGGRNVFNEFVNDTNTALTNAERLGRLLNSKDVNFSQKDKIYNAMFEFFDNKVIQNKMPFEEFIKKYGKNYEFILPKNVYQSFKTNVGNAQKEVEKLLEKQIAMTKNTSEALPGIGTNINDMEPYTIVRNIFRLGNETDVSKLKAAFKGDDFKHIQMAYLDEMFNVTKIPNVGMPGQNIRAFDGVKLYEFLKNNDTVITKMFGKDFFDTHMLLAKSLGILQKPDQMSKIATGLGSDIAKSQLYTQIILGPLSHEGLIMRNLGKIYDRFDLSGNSVKYLLEYQKFVNLAKKQFLAGNYPKFFNNLTVPQQRSFISKMWNAPEVLLEKVTTPVLKPVVKGTLSVLDKTPVLGRLFKTGVQRQPISSKYLMLQKYLESKTIDPFISMFDESFQDYKGYGESSIAMDEVTKFIKRNYSKTIGKALNEINRRYIQAGETKKLEPELIRAKKGNKTDQEK